MVSPAAAHLAVGILGNFISFSLYLSPAPTFYRICKKGSVEQYSATPYLLTFFNCMLWTIYGMPFIQPNNILLSTISGSGCVIEFIYLMLFIVYFGNKKKRIILILIVLGQLLAVGTALALVLSLTHTTKQRSLIFGLLGDISGVLMYAAPLSIMAIRRIDIGLLGDISGVLMYAAPLSIMKEVIKSKSVEYMPLPVSVTCFGNALIWTLYAIRPFDPYVVVPNGIGCFLGLAQLILYAAYYKSTKQQIAARKAAELEKIEMGLQEVIVVTRDPNKVNNLPEIDCSTPDPDPKEEEPDFATNV